MTAERRGDAWLVVIGGNGTSERISAIGDLTVGPIDLAAEGPVSPPAGSLCTIGYTHAPGSQETTEDAITSPRDTRQAFYNAGQRIANAAYARLTQDQARFPHDHARIAADEAALALADQALSRRIQLDALFPPTCARATFYYQQRWPISATIALGTKDCPGPRVFVPCNKLRPPWRNTIVHTVKPIRNNPSEFIVPANLFHPLETVKQIEKWWLVIAGGANHAQQQLLLNHLTTNVDATLRKQLRGAVTTPLVTAHSAIRRTADPHRRIPASNQSWSSRDRPVAGAGLLFAQGWSTDASRAACSGAQLRRAGDESTRRFGSALITSISATPLAHCLMMNYARRPLA